MKAVLLAGGLGTRLSEETAMRPKPMVEIGGRPILWHIMKIYAAHGVNDFIVCLGYKGYVIKEYFANYFLHSSDVTFKLASNEMMLHRAAAEPWTVTLVETGEDTQIGGRIKRILPHVADDDAFCLTYGDGVGDVDISAVDRAAPKQAAGSRPSPPCSRPAASARSCSRATRSPAFRKSRAATAAGSTAASLSARPRSATISTATPRSGSASRWSGSRPRASSARIFHDGFWQPMDTLRDRRHLEELWASGKAPWKVW